MSCLFDMGNFGLNIFVQSRVMSYIILEKFGIQPIYNAGDNLLSTASLVFSVSSVHRAYYIGSKRVCFMVFLITTAFSLMLSKHTKHSNVGCIKSMIYLAVQELYSL